MLSLVACKASLFVSDSRWIDCYQVIYVSRTELLKAATDLGIHHARSRKLGREDAVVLAHDEDRDSFERTGILAYERMIYLIDKMGSYVADDCNGYWTIQLSGDRVKEFIARWLDKDFDYLRSVKHENATRDCR